MNTETQPVKLKLMEPQLFTGTREEYNAIEALSQSWIKTAINKTAKHARARFHKTSTSMSKGTVVHALALLDGSFEVSPYDEFRTNEAKAWRDDRLERKITFIKKAEVERVEFLAANVKASILDILDGADYVTEQAMIWTMDTAYGPIQCKGLMDVWSAKAMAILDPKITGNGLSDDEINRFFTKFGAGIQSKFYRDGLAAIYPLSAGRVKFKNVFIEDDDLGLVRTAENSGAWDELAASQISYGAHLYAKGLYTGEWDGYPPHIRVVPRPYEFKDFIADEMEELESTNVA